MEDWLVAFEVGAPMGVPAGVQVLSKWEDISAIHIRASKAAAEALAKNPNVVEVAPDAQHQAFGYTDSFPITWGLKAVKAQEAWAGGAKGATIKVCVLDTGIDYGHPEFFRNGVSIIKGSKNFMNDGRPDAQDYQGHGTHVAGTIAAQGARVLGVAPDIELYVAKVLGDNGSGSSSGILNGVKWCNETVGTHVANLSLGSSMKSVTEQRAYDKAYNQGMLIIAAAGNDGSSRLSYPASYTSVVSVAAVDSNLVKADFSQYNKEVELAAPGVAVYSSVPRGHGTESSAKEDNTAYTANGLEFSGQGNVTGPLVECGLATSTTSCTNKPSSGAWVALVSRGEIAFSDKVNNVKAQGASAVIITNNDTANADDAGSFTLGAAGSWLPTVSVSYNSGVAIRNGGLGTGNVVVGPSDYAYYNGTSMASPHAAAVAAVAWSAKPTLTNATIRQILQQTAVDLGAAGRDTSFGFGLVQADAAAALARTK